MKKLSVILEGQKAFAKLHPELRDHYHPRNYSADHVMAVRSYTGSSGVNQHLWNKHRDQPENAGKKWNFDDSFFRSHKKGITPDEQHVLKHLPDALSMQGTPSKLTVYSSTKYDPRDVMDKNHTVHHPAFLSTSLDKKFSNGFNTFSETRDDSKRVYHNHLMKIHIPKGHAGIYAGADVKFSAHRHEAEFILPAGTNLRHLRTEHKVQEDPGIPGSGGHLPYTQNNYLHHMEVV